MELKNIMAGVAVSVAMVGAAQAAPRCNSGIFTEACATYNKDGSMVNPDMMQRRGASAEYDRQANILKVSTQKTSAHKVRRVGASAPQHGCK